ncbi:MAG TPA: bifunctional (p)ppGpp synthetase/guanosine-3',5'-bis(diphosphate) 3'-pyrophosphohydrolase [Bacillota bacterium]|nr:bifunctional (p)ppGpp synthetase/guanosine-3',5'-bis(diphosphate) 3'-pyrophosphohydrolase [Bacillota bacterium]HQD76910.1 bifunctional (p)ppGpp synthetase/guanosine-3',5'-bis(diphosphate) 3'-pyrophosphohydrolase [Bacillota bacterium]HUM59384.1 bifunctional (p)ppGpp synthetase/guanosine-3',5'-bis(diphosphate) 3'-pyrophosphohydrolase [Bacillota bacterium]
MPAKPQDLDHKAALEELFRLIKAYNANVDIAAIQAAYEYAEKAHRNQKRFSGEPYIVHPLEVAKILAQLELDPETIMAGLLHDVVEDTGITLEDIQVKFGKEVALLVDGVTKLSRFEFKSKEEQQAENLRKMFLAMAKDIRVILIKLADRLHNLRTLKYHPVPKQQEIAQETLEIFAPLAHRLGIYRIKWELEDLSFRFKEPDRYFELVKKIAETRKKREEKINYVISILQDKLKTMGISAVIEGRPKHLYSINEKMIKQNVDLNEIYDVMAVRCLVDTVKDCYATLGIVHTMWTPIPGRFKDFIAMPKSNMYQSLHTTVVGPLGEPLEIQIRTMEMHKTAEYGIAAHWRYKEGTKGDSEFDKKLAWLRQLLEWQHELRDAREFMENLKIDLFDDAVFVFSPKGDVLELPAGSVPLDFAYRIHTDVGHRCIGAKVNGRIVPLDYVLKNGDIVEILTSKNSAPKRDWLNIVKTSQSRTKIKQWFKKENREENILKGRELLEREARKQGLEAESLKPEKLLEIGKKLSFFTLEELFAAIGDGVITANSILNKIKLEEARSEKRGLLSEEVQTLKNEIKLPAGWRGKPTQGIRVKGIDNLLVRLSHCCNPVPGDPILGYITRGRGISIHRIDCRNITTYMQCERERLVDVAWDEEFKDPFQVKLEVNGMDRSGFLSDIMAVLVDMKISANWVTARGKKDGGAVVDLVLEIKDLVQLEHIMNRIKRIKDVYDVKRVSFNGQPQNPLN